MIELFWLWLLKVALSLVAGWISKRREDAWAEWIAIRKKRAEDMRKKRAEWRDWVKQRRKFLKSQRNR